MTKSCVTNNRNKRVTRPSVINDKVLFYDDRKITILCTSHLKQATITSCCLRIEPAHHLRLEVAPSRDDRRLREMKKAKSNLNTFLSPHRPFAKKSHGKCN